MRPRSKLFIIKGLFLAPYLNTILIPDTTDLIIELPRMLTYDDSNDERNMGGVTLFVRE